MNLKPQDLRIGNAVQDKSGREWVIHELLESYCRLGESIDGFDLSLGYSELQPISLTEEWLLKFGFKDVTEEHDESLSFELESGRKAFRIVKLEPSLWMVIYRVDIGMNFNELTDIEHVHDLQNIVHALTGEELSIKQPVQ